VALLLQKASRWFAAFFCLGRPCAALVFEWLSFPLQHLFFSHFFFFRGAVPLIGKFPPKIVGVYISLFPTPFFFWVFFFFRCQRTPDFVTFRFKHFAPCLSLWFFTLFPGGDPSPPASLLPPAAGQEQTPLPFLNVRFFARRHLFPCTRVTTFLPGAF